MGSPAVLARFSISASFAVTCSLTIHTIPASNARALVAVDTIIAFTMAGAVFVFALVDVGSTIRARVALRTAAAAVAGYASDSSSV